MVAAHGLLPPPQLRLQHLQQVPSDDISHPDIGHSACKCDCVLLLTPSPSQHMLAVQASATPGQGFPHPLSISYLFLHKALPVVLQWILSPLTHKSAQTEDTQPPNTTAATLLPVPQQLETAHKHVSLLGRAALLTSSSLLTRVQACPKISPSPYEYLHTLFPPVTPTQASANP